MIGMTARLLGGLVALAVAAGGLWSAGLAFSGRRSVAPAADEWTAPPGWTSLPAPPELREGSTLLWAGSEVLLWGGCDVAVRNDCRPTADGYRFDPTREAWSRLSQAPLAAAWSDAVWTGEEALFLAGPRWGYEGEEGAMAYRPSTHSWRTIASPPVRAMYGNVIVWTGKEVVVWGGGNRDGDTNRRGAAYDPVTDTWRTLPEAPLGLNQASGVWTGREVLVFGSLLDHRNWAETDTSVGAAYNPGSDSWRTLPPSELSPQATSAVWAGERLLAWDYEVTSQEYDPRTDTWDEPVEMPLRFSECYPDSALVGEKVFAFFCGTAALWDPAAGAWTRARGGPLDVEIEGDPNGLLEWRFAAMASAGEFLFVLAEGVTVNERGVPCYGCEGSRVSFWSYRPAA